MLHAFFVLDSTKFTLFEYFPDRSKSSEIIQGLETLDKLDGTTQTRGIRYHIQQFTEKFYLCVAYENENLSAIIMKNLPKLATNIMGGDKVSLRQVLNSSTLGDFANLF